GNVIVRNIDFEKRVFARYSTDEWGSYTETNGTYASSVHGGIDRFTFNLDLAELFASTEERLLKRKVVKMALRFEAQGREFWDNCCGTNYEVELT
ncbi:putative phosphatase regulatory subunit, partial [Cladochytrium replicatum]